MKKTILSASLLALTSLLTSASSPTLPPPSVCDAEIGISGTDWCQEGLVPVFGYSSDPNATYYWQVIGTGATLLNQNSQDTYVRLRSNANFQLKLTVNGTCSYTTETFTYQDFVDLCD